jgi:hypothetical protein
MNNYEKMIKVLTIFSNNFKGTNMVVGGSMAMYVHGFEVEPHDLDIELENPDKSTLTTLQTMDKVVYEQDNSVKPLYEKFDGHYRIMILGVYVDVWVLEKIDYKRVVEYQGFKFGDVISVLKHKMRMHRDKDYKALTKYIEQLISTQPIEL